MTRPTPWLLPMLAAIMFAWWATNLPWRGPDATGEINSVSFAPYRAGQSPLAGVFPSAAQVEADIALLAPAVRAIRSYAAIEGDYDVAAIAERHGVKLWQGIWLGADRAQNAREIARAVAMANRHPATILRVVVGNEVLLRRDLPPAELIAAIEQVRAAVSQPVTYADVWEFWERFPEIAAHVDLVTIHLLPYWEDRPVAADDAVAHVGQIWRRIAGRFPGKPIVIGETGWPSRGRWRSDAAPGPVAQARFTRGFLALARREGFDYNLIEAFDQGWKHRSEGTVGANWGLWTETRTGKPVLAGPVVDNPDWPWHASLSVVLALGLLGIAGAAAAASIQLGSLAAVLGAALGYAVSATWPVAYDGWLCLAAFGNLAGQTLLAALLMRRARRILSGRPSPLPRSGAQATSAVRSWLRLRPVPIALDDLGFVFLWAAMVLQLLLLVDPRYRDFPLPAFAVPLVTVGARAMLGDLPRSGGGWEEAVAGGVLAAAALSSAVQEGALNLPSLVWTAAALILAAAALLRLRGHS